MTIDVNDAPTRSRYEITEDGEQAGFARYRDIGTTRVFDHTEIDPDRGGRGLGGTLIKHALDSSRAAGRSVVALCPFVDRYIREHPEYGDLVDTELDSRLRT